MKMRNMEVRWLGSFILPLALGILLVNGQQTTTVTTILTTTPMPRLQMSRDEKCDFGSRGDLSQCNWENSNSTILKWATGRGSLSYMLGGPPNDHTEDNNMGGYTFVETSLTSLPGVFGDKVTAMFESGIREQTAVSGTCVRFWFNVDGLSADRLRVVLNPSDEDLPPGVAREALQQILLWEYREITAGAWSRGEILYAYPFNHQLIFEAQTKPASDPVRNYRGYIALDDISFEPATACTGHCTFEGDLCGWTQARDDEFDWKHGKGSSNRLTGPPRDHSSFVNGGFSGGFIYIDSLFPRRPGDVARLMSPAFIQTGDSAICFTFWTHMYGSGTGILRVLIREEGRGGYVSLWTVSGESGNTWHNAQVTVYAENNFKIVLEGIIGKNSLGTIAVDDVAIRQGACPSIPQTAVFVQGDCTFEVDECGWANMFAGGPDADQFDWMRYSTALVGHSNQARLSEPLADHTTMTPGGYFMTLERTNVPVRSGDRSVLLSPVIPGSPQPICMNFWVYMNERVVDATGPALGTLAVHIRPVPITGQAQLDKTPLWRLTNYEIPRWFQGQVTINTPKDYQVAFVATWGSSRQGVIAVDDISFYSGVCGLRPPEAAPKIAECTFDRDTCLWTHGNSSLPMTSWQLADPIRRPSNLQDHTFQGQAGYIFFDIFTQIPNSVTIESPEIQESTACGGGAKCCMGFWFAPFGGSENTQLQILLRDMSSGQDNELWKVKTGDFRLGRPEWMFGQVEFPTDSKYKIIFSGKSNNGGFALDDIVLYKGDCKNLNPSRNASTTSTSPIPTSSGPSQINEATSARPFAALASDKREGQPSPTDSGENGETSNDIDTSLFTTPGDL